MLSNNHRGRQSSQNGDCHEFPPLELDGCPRFADGSMRDATILRVTANPAASRERLESVWRAHRRTNMIRQAGKPPTEAGPRSSRTGIGSA
jgi:hypothetical protein